MSAAQIAAASGNAIASPMLTLLTLLVSIGLADSVDPAMVVPAVYFAGMPHAARAVAGFALGAFAVNVAGGVAIAVGPGRVLLRVLPHPGPTLTDLLELGAGGALMLAAVVLWRRRARSLESFGGHRHVERAAPLVGAGIALAELPTAVPYFVVIAAIVHARLGSLADAALLALYQLLYLAPVLAIAALSWHVSRGRAGSRVEGLRRLLERYESSVVAILLFAVAVVLLLLGATGLVGLA